MPNIFLRLLDWRSRRPRSLLSWHETIAKSDTTRIRSAGPWVLGWTVEVDKRKAMDVHWMGARTTEKSG